MKRAFFTLNGRELMKKLNIPEGVVITDIERKAEYDVWNIYFSGEEIEGVGESCEGFAAWRLN